MPDCLTICNTLLNLTRRSILEGRTSEFVLVSKVFTSFKEPNLKAVSN